MTTSTTAENLVYRVVAKEDPTDARLFAYILSAEQLNRLKSGDLVNSRYIASSIPVNILDEKVSDKDAPKLVMPNQFFKGDFPDHLAITTEWERLVTEILNIPIIGNVVLSKEDIFAKQHYSIHPDIDNRVKDAIAKLTETHS